MPRFGFPDRVINILTLIAVLAAIIASLYAIAHPDFLAPSNAGLFDVKTAYAEPPQDHLPPGLYVLTGMKAAKCVDVVGFVLEDGNAVWFLSDVFAVVQFPKEDNPSKMILDSQRTTCYPDNMRNRDDAVWNHFLKVRETDGKTKVNDTTVTPEGIWQVGLVHEFP